MTATATTTATPEARVERVRIAEVAVEAIQDDRSSAAWGEYVRNARGGTVFHDPIWCEVVERAFGHRGLNLLARRGGRVVGVLPLVEVRSLFGGRMLVSVPYGTYGGILADDEAVCAALGAEACRLTRARRARVLDLRSAEAVLPGLESVERYDAFVRELPLHPNELETYLPRRARAAARQARERDGVVVEHDRRRLRTVWELYCRSMRRLGSINYPYRFLASLLERLGERAWVTVAQREGRPIAGTISLVHGETVMPYVVGVDERQRCTGVTNLLYFAVMERAVRSGLRRFDFGRTRKDNVGSASFKKNQGFEPRTLGYQRYTPPGRVAPDLSPSNRRFDLARRIWPRLPLSLTRPVGEWLARSIPG